MTALSIIVPAYNAAPFLKRCLKSIVNQRLDKSTYEVILVNDGSTDSTLDVAKEFEQELPLHIFSQKNQGLSTARNVGIALSHGEWICFVDSDDELFPDALPKVLEVAIDDTELLTYLFTSKYSEENQASFPVKTEHCTGQEIIVRHNPSNYAWQYLIRRRVLSSSGLRFQDGHFCEDSMFTLELLLICQHCIRTNILAYHYIVRPGSIMTSTDRAHMLKMIADYEFVIDHFSHLLSTYKDRISPACRHILMDRRNAFTFFMLMRCIRAKVKDQYLRDLIKRLRSKGLYPFSLSYGGKYRILVAMANRPQLLRLANCLYRSLPLKA